LHTILNLNISQGIYSKNTTAVAQQLRDITCDWILLLKS